MYVDACVRENSILLARLAESWDKSTALPIYIDRNSQITESDESSQEEDDENPLYVEFFATRLHARAQVEQLLVCITTYINPNFHICQAQLPYHI